MRRSKKYSRSQRPLNTQALMGYTSFEEGRDGETYKVHRISAARKQYICPSCNGIISVGESHVVVWTEDTLFGARYGQENRRHWHSSCWQHRGRLR